MRNILLLLACLFLFREEWSGCAYAADDPSQRVYSVSLDPPSGQKHQRPGFYAPYSKRRFVDVYRALETKKEHTDTPPSATPPKPAVNRGGIGLVGHAFPSPDTASGYDPEKTGQHIPSRESERESESHAGGIGQVGGLGIPPSAGHSPGDALIIDPLAPPQSQDRNQNSGIGNIGGGIGSVGGIGTVGTR